MSARSRSSAPRTRIDGGTIVAFDGKEHRLLEGGVVVYEGNRITHVGRDDAKAADHVIDARGKLVIPGQISVHAHIGTHDGARLVIDGGRRAFLRTGFLNFVPVRLGGGPPFSAPGDRAAALRYGMACLLRNGITTVVAFDPGGSDGGKMMVDLAGEMGLRLYYAPFATGGAYGFDEDGRLHQVWNEPAGMEGLERAGRFIEEFDGAHEGRVKGIVVVDEFHFATVPMLRRAKELAQDLGVSLTFHFVEQVWEFHETLRSRGMTPVELLAAEGILGPDVILAHCIYVAGHSATAYRHGGDIAEIARSGAHVAHAPLGFARRGVALESFQRYLDHGLNMAMGTDVHPMDMFAEMRAASMSSKWVETDHESAPSRDVFDASNLGGAKALGRSDLGRIAPGAKADIVLVDFDSLTIGPVPDAIRALVHLATPDMVDTVIVDGRTVVEGKRLVVCDERQVLAAARQSSDKVLAGFSAYNWAGRTAEEEFPPSLKRWED